MKINCFYCNTEYVEEQITKSEQELFLDLYVCPNCVPKARVAVES